MQTKTKEKLKTKARTIGAKVLTAAASVEILLIEKDAVIEKGSDADAQIVAFEHTAVEVIEYFAVRG